MVSVAGGRYQEPDTIFDQPDLSGPAIMRKFGRFDRPVTEIGASHRHHQKERKDQETDHPKRPLEPSTPSGITSNENAGAILHH